VPSLQRTAIFIRHGQSLANIGQWPGPFGEAPLSTLGEQQAEALAATWNVTPALIAVSAYTRAQQTAAPTIARFPGVPVETWPIHEFTFWDPIYWGGTFPAESMEDVMKFWRVADPTARRDVAGSENSESFSDLLHRTEATLDRLAALDAAAPVLLFTHGHFMQALRHTLQWPHWTHAQKMANFHAYDAEFHVLNTECITVTWDEQSAGQRKWRLS
jgi:broad specificity phosphatase PhoE